MASRAPRPCTHPGCSKLSRDGSGRCEDHPRRHGWKHTASTTQRGYGAGWRKIRAMVLRRDEGLCVPCREKMVFTAATEVDHIIPKAQGGTDSPDNLQSICARCHRAKTAREGRG